MSKKKALSNPTAGATNEVKDALDLAILGWNAGLNMSDMDEGSRALVTVLMKIDGHLRSALAALAQFPSPAQS